MGHNVIEIVGASAGNLGGPFIRIRIKLQSFNLSIGHSLRKGMMVHDNIKSEDGSYGNDHNAASAL